MSRFAAQARTMQQAVGQWQGASQSSGGGLQDIIGQMQTAQEKANMMNEQRYRDILSLYENLGQAGRARITQETGQRQAAATQGLISKGLGSTTITSAVERGIASDAELQRQQLEETVSLQRAGVMERRTDAGPDLGMFASLLQAAGQQQPTQRRVSTRTGAMAAAGRTGAGTPFRYGGDSAEAGGGRTIAAAPAGTGPSGPVGGGLDLTPPPPSSYPGSTVFMGEKGMVQGAAPEDIGESRTLTSEERKKYGRWLGMGWGHLVPSWARDQLK